MDELEYTPKDILDQDIPFEILPEARSAHLHCPECGEPMVVVETTRTIMRGRFTIPYKVYKCPTCERRYLNPEQADHFSAIQRLEQLIEEQDQRVEGDVLFDGRDLFVRLALAREMFRPSHIVT